MADDTFLGRGYVRRLIDDDLDELFEQLPAILLDGPKGVGKTATASTRAATVRALDDDPQRLLIEGDPSLIRGDARPVLIDEWQRAPSVWDAVRRAVDDDPVPGRFLLTGSAPTEATRVHSGAGRITSLRMRPLTLHERGCTGPPTVSMRTLLAGTAPTVTGKTEFGLADYVDEIVRGGFPGMRHFEGRALTAQLDGYLEALAQRDLPASGFTPRRAAGTLKRWMTAYAAATATTASLDKVRDAATGLGNAAPARSTGAAYLSVLSELRIVDPVEGWSTSRNHLKRVGIAPKHHLADPALAVRLLGLNVRHLLHGEQGPVPFPRDGSLLGCLFESLVSLSVRTYAQNAAANTYHLRENGGRHEIDLIVEADSAVLAIEVKLSGTVEDRDVRHILWLREAIGPDLVDAVVVTSGPEAYRRRDGIAVIPLALLGP